VNRPGLGTLGYRVGTHGSFLETMLARLSAPDFPDLHGLASRSGDDAAIALLDAWATVGDVLTFYQERIANEGYLRTASERRSAVEVGRLVGYELRPGVAASVFLAYTLDKDLKGSDSVATVPKGSRAQSVPGPDELPQPFETSEDLVASSAWNDLKPRLWRPLRLFPSQAPSLEEIYVDGVATNLKPGDLILLVFGTREDVRVPLKVKTVTPQQIVPDPPGPPLSRTIVTFQQPERAAVAAARAHVASVLERARDLGAVRLADRELAVEIDADVLGPLEDVIGRRTSEHDLADAGSAALAKLQERLAFAESEGEDVAADWLRRTEDELRAAVGPLQERFEAVNRDPRSQPRVRRPGSAVTAIGEVMGALNVRKPIQPSGALELERSPKALFGAGSDLGPRLLVDFNPSLSESLYQTWASATVAAPSSLQSVQAMRVKAAPFGATAAPRPVFDARGAIVGSEEWPLQEAVVLGVRVQLVRGDIPRELEISATTAGETSKIERDARPFKGTIPLRPGRVDLKVTDDPSIITVRFEAGLPKLTMTIKAAGHDRVSVKLSDDSRVWQPHPGEVLRHRRGSHRVSVALSEVTGQNDLVLTVTDEVLEAPSPRNILPLDAQYDQVVAGSWVVLDWGTSDRATIVRRVTEVEAVAKTAYNLSAKVTQLRLSDSWLEPADILLSAIRNVSVYVQSEPITLAPEPVDDDVAGSSIELGAVYRGLEAGRWVIVEGERTDIPGTHGVKAAELAMLAGVVQDADPTLPGDTVHTTILLARSLAYTYKRSTVKVWGNVVHATHGESRPELPGTTVRTEVLGSGDARKAFQEFGLKGAPLTYLAASNPLGAESTLDVRVNSVLWHQADSLALLGPNDRRYVTRTDADDRTMVVFGDGRRGARPPTGVENIRAEYRTGVGKRGNVKAGQITQLQTRPLGVSGVGNPLPATGGADRDTLEQARRNIPIAVEALDRLVSVEDHEDFARSRAGIGKASARPLSDGNRLVVHLTIAGADDIPIDTSSDLYRALRTSLAEWGDPAQPVEVAVRELVLLVISAGVEIDPDYRWSEVEPRIRAGLLATFGFDRRELGQNVFLSEVQSAVQMVRGVVSVDVDVLASVPGTITPAALAELADQLIPPPAARIPVEAARFERRTYRGQPGDTLTSVAAEQGIPLAELLRLNPKLRPAELADLDGIEIILTRGIRSAQLALLSAAIPDTLILREVKR
jgi:predicted phage baseplate assembly protein